LRYEKKNYLRLNTVKELREPFPLKQELKLRPYRVRPSRSFALKTRMETLYLLENQCFPSDPTKENERNGYFLGFFLEIIGGFQFLIYLCGYIRIP
jgi:hypothetical protein